MINICMTGSYVGSVNLNDTGEECVLGLSRRTSGGGSGSVQALTGQLVYLRYLDMIAKALTLCIIEVMTQK